MEEKKLQLTEDLKCYILILAGGMGARIIQTGFVRSLMKQRKLDGNDTYPIIVLDNSLIGEMVGVALSDKNVFGIQVPENHHGFPVDPGVSHYHNGQQEHPIFIESWRTNFKQYETAGQGSFHKLIHSNLNRTYQIEYGFSLTKMIHQNKLKDDKRSFIGNLYAKTMGLEWDGGYPILGRNQETDQLKTYCDNLDKPFILMHIGMDRNSQDFMTTINYRTHKVWSLERYRDVANELKDQYHFIQVYANQHNPTIEGVTSVKVENLHQVLQLLEHPKCYSYLCTDNYLPHLAASIQKSGVVLWGSVSPLVWGWDHNVNIWNKFSCAEIACWRPGMFDVTPDGKTFVCDHYSCMRSIKVKQVVDAIEIVGNKNKKQKTKLQKISL